MKVVIIGGVAGGAGTAARLRRLSESVKILMIEQGRDISYANCGIPYHIGGVIKEREDLLEVSEEYFENALGVDVRTLSKATAIDRARKSVMIKDLASGRTYEETYDKLVLSPGAEPIRPPLPGIGDERVFTLRNLEDMDRMIALIKSKRSGKAVIIGGGLIGLEMAENMTNRGFSVTVLERTDQTVGLLDPEMAAPVHRHLMEKGVRLFLRETVTGFESGQRNLLNVMTKSGLVHETDMALISAGVRPETALAGQAGLALGSLGGIRVNEKMETSDPDIYALGDAAEIREAVSGSEALIPLANSANKQGRIVADNIMGHNRKYTATAGTAIARVFDLTVAATGLNEKILKAKSIPCAVIHLNPPSRARYYPGASRILIKLLYSPQDRRVLGSQMVGRAGVDKRIDVISTLIQNKGTVDDLSALELAYAPPYSSAKDPVNLAGMIAINHLEGRCPLVYSHEVSGLVREKAFFLDVRPAVSFKRGHIETSVNIPLDELAQRMNEIPRDKKIIVYCNQGKSSYFALSRLRNSGFREVYSLSGGFTLYDMASQAHDGRNTVP